MQKMAFGSAAQVLLVGVVRVASYIARSLERVRIKGVWDLFDELGVASYSDHWHIPLKFPNVLEKIDGVDIRACFVPLDHIFSKILRVVRNSVPANRGKLNSSMDNDTYEDRPATECDAGPGIVIGPFDGAATAENASMESETPVTNGCMAAKYREMTELKTCLHAGTAREYMHVVFPTEYPWISPATQRINLGRVHS
jgi:hypothetical protein